MSSLAMDGAYEVSLNTMILWPKRIEEAKTNNPCDIFQIPGRLQNTR